MGEVTKTEKWVIASLVPVAVGLLIAFLLFLQAGCALQPQKIAEGIADCEFYGLSPVAIVRRDAVRRVNCLPSDEYLIIERELELIKLPELPTLPRD